MRHKMLRDRLRRPVAVLHIGNVVPPDA
jgi:hypothetical protein